MGRGITEESFFRWLLLGCVPWMYPGDSCGEVAEGLAEGVSDAKALGWGSLRGELST